LRGDVPPISLATMLRREAGICAVVIAASLSVGCRAADVESDDSDVVVPTLGPDSAAGCGDGMTSSGEQCDDGNRQSDDGCSRLCVRERLALGGLHSCLTTSDGVVRCCGANASGQLGLGDSVARGELAGEELANFPVVELGTGFVVDSVVAGAFSNCARSSTGAVKCWGAGQGGALGSGNTSSLGDDANEMGDNLLAVDLGTEVKALAAGASHYCALHAGNGVKCWGANAKGLLGLGDTTSRGEEPGQMGASLPTLDLGTNAEVVALAPGGGHTCALLSNGTAKCWGDGSSGQLGLGDLAARADQPGEMGDALPSVDLGPNAKIVALVAGGMHTCALLADATIKCWGGNVRGQLGLGDTESHGDQPSEMGQQLPPVRLPSGVHPVDLAAGSEHTCVLSSAGEVWCWGAIRSASSVTRWT
jgi:cysteine-rich repeat protein